MPPRYAYWTILIDQKPTAFRAREREELLPTLNQLRRKNSDVALKWFARGTLWDSPAAAQAAQHAPRPAVERRGRDWRPGGEHRDPRDRFKKKPKGPVHRPHTTSGRNDTEKKPFASRPPDHRGPKPFQSRSKGARDRALPFSSRGQSDGPRKPSGPRPSQAPKPWQRKPWRPPTAPTAKNRKPPEDE